MARPERAISSRNRSRRETFRACKLLCQHIVVKLELSQVNTQASKAARLQRTGQGSELFVLHGNLMHKGLPAAGTFP